MRIQLIDPDPGSDGSPERHARMVPILGTVGLPTLVLAGAEIDVPDEVAGAGPSWRAPREGDDLAFMETKPDGDGGVKSVHDLGHGLLSQVDIWSRVDAPAPRPSAPVAREGGGK